MLNLEGPRQPQVVLFRHSWTEGSVDHHTGVNKSEKQSARKERICSLEHISTAVKASTDTQRAHQCHSVSGEMQYLKRVWHQMEVTPDDTLETVLV